MKIDRLELLLTLRLEHIFFRDHLLLRLEARFERESRVLNRLILSRLILKETHLLSLILILQIKSLLGLTELRRLTLKLIFLSHEVWLARCLLIICNGKLQI